MKPLILTKLIGNNGFEVNVEKLIEPNAVCSGFVFNQFNAYPINSILYCYKKIGKFRQKTFPIDNPCLASIEQIVLENLERKRIT